MLSVHKNFLDDIKYKLEKNNKISKKNKERSLKRLKYWIESELEGECESFDGIEDFTEESEELEISNYNIGKSFLERLLYWQDYYSIKPDDCPDEEWPLFNTKTEISRYGRTRLHELCISGTIEEVMQELNKCDIDIYAKDNGGNTAYELAVLENRMDIVELFRNLNI